MRIAHESAILQPFLDQRLSLFQREPVDMHVVDQWKINVAGIADPHLTRQFRNVVHTHFNQISGTESHHHGLVEGVFCSIGSLRDRTRCTDGSLRQRLSGRKLRGRAACSIRRIVRWLLASRTTDDGQESSENKPKAAAAASEM